MRTIVPGDVRLDGLSACGKLQTTRGVGSHCYHVGEVAHALDNDAHLGERWKHDLNLEPWLGIIGSFPLKDSM